MTPITPSLPRARTSRGHARSPKVHARDFLAKTRSFDALASSAIQDCIRKNGLFSKKPHRGVPVDGNGNVRALVKADAANPAASAITARYAYDGFGKEVAVSGADADKNAFRFSTKQLDVETGMNYYGYRFYDSNNGRWINRDPIEEGGGVNFYAMISNNTISSWDLNGLKCCLITMRAGGDSLSGHSILKCNGNKYISWNPSGPQNFIPGFPASGENHTEEDDFGPGSHYGDILEGELMTDGTIKTDKGREGSVVCLDCINGDDVTMPGGYGPWANSWNPLNNCSDASCRQSDEAIKDKKPKCPCGQEAQNLLDRHLTQTPRTTEQQFKDVKENGCKKWKCVKKDPIIGGGMNSF